MQLDNIIPGEPPIILHGIQDASMAAIQIELATGEELPKLLKAAAKVLERVAQTQGEQMTKSVVVMDIAQEERQHFIESPIRIDTISSSVLLVAKSNVKERTAP